MTLIEVLARALSGEPLDELSASVASVELAELAPSATDVVFCWWVRGLAIPDTVIARARAALVGAPASHRASLALMSGEPTEVPSPPEGGWEELARWAIGASPLALPGLDRGALAGREEDLLRGVGLALLLRDASLAARLLRWLALSMPADTVRDAFDLTARLARAPNDSLVATRVALAVQQRANPSHVQVVSRPQPPPGVLAAERRHAFLDRAIGWVEQHLDRFRVRTDETDLRAVQRYKAVGELALVASHVIDAGEREGQASWCARGAALQAFALSQIGDGDRLAEMIERTPPLAAFVTMLPALHRAGLRNERLSGAIVRAAPSLGADLAYLVGASMRAIGLPSSWELEAAFGWTRLASEPTPWLLEAPQLYLLLHEMWYRAADGWPDERGRAYITRWLPVWLRYMEMSGFYDLLAELIITWHALHGTAAPVRAWDALIAAQRDDGAIPTARPGVNPGATVMIDEYHATLNAIWAAATHPASSSPEQGS